METSTHEVDSVRDQRHVQDIEIHIEDLASISQPSVVGSQL